MPQALESEGVRRVWLLAGVAIAVVVVLVVAASLLGDDGEQAEMSAGAGTTAPTTAVTAPPSVVTLPPVTAVTPAPICVVTVEPGDSLTVVASRGGVGLADLEAENAVSAADTIHPGEVFDICIGNDVDDVTGASRVAPPLEAVTVQQNELNELFGSTSMLPLAVDGDSGNYTRQAACAARMGLGLPVHTGHIVPGSEEEAAIFAATELSIPAGAPVDANKWILIDKTCQVIFIGEGNERLVDVFPTSTGEPGYQTHNVQAHAFRFDPALDNDGWHDSASFPVEVDNPVNGNMYKPLYFNNGQAIHGAGFIPPTPRSKGCARTFPLHQDMMIEWLGLDDLTEATWSADRIGVTVVVQGRFRDLSPAATT